MDDFSLDKSPVIIIDFGLRLTKVGFGSEPEPRKILQTPNLFNFQEYAKSTLPHSTILNYQKEIYDVKYKIEEFVTNLINVSLQVKRQQRERPYICYVLIDECVKSNFKKVYEVFCNLLISHNAICSLVISPKNAFPVFTSSLASGIIFNGGFAFSTITVVNNGVSIYSKMLPIGMASLMKKYKEMILEDINGYQEDEKKKLSDSLDDKIEDILIRTSVIIKRDLINEIEKDIEKFKTENDYTKVDCYDNLPSFNISFFNRVCIGEYIFTEEEGDVAYEVLDAIMNHVPCECKKKIAGNIILSGGMTMLFGFYRRFDEQIKFLVENSDNFNKIKCLKDSLRVHKIIFPRNCLSWIGASLISNFDKLNFDKKISKDENDVLDGDVIGLLSD